MSAALRIVLTGGGTGGHVYPALSVVEAGQVDHRSPECLWVGTNRGLEQGIVAKTAIPFASIDAGAVRGRTPLALAGSAARNLRGLVQARRLIGSFRPDVVLATGGFVCVPVVLAARLAGIPTVVYLPDLRPGWAVRFLARVATAVAVSFDEVKPHIRARRVEVTGYPVRPELLGGDPALARRQLDLPGDRPVVVAIGGSRGAQTINDALAGDGESLVRQAYVVHASGETHYDAVRTVVERLPAEIRSNYRLYSYFDAELGPAMIAATVVVSRAGASTLGELPAVGAPGILVPYPHSGAHQAMNASFLADRGAAVVVEDAAARAGGLGPAILELLGNPSRLAEMAAAARRLARPDAASRLFDLLRDVAGAADGATVKRRLA